MKENRSRVALMENMQTAQDVARQLGTEWRALSQKEREKWDKMAVDDRQRYDRERTGTGRL